jgi:2-polyprenyl-3-methyl-5-hydroxy-6-metoxy-1,4-benzoquinol methylase
MQNRNSCFLICGIFREVKNRNDMNKGIDKRNANQFRPRLTFGKPGISLSPGGPMPEIHETVCEMANSFLEGKNHIKLLEAGCGSTSRFIFKADVHAVGIDISPQELEQNSDLHEKILGDIQDYPLPKKEFDVVVCWMVLEHLSRPKEALLNMFSSVKPRGLLILGIPNVFSFKGIVTKITPFWVHRLLYQFIGNKRRPFPTRLRVAILPEKISRLAEDNGFSTEFCKLEEGWVPRKVRRRFWFADVAFRVQNSVAQVISFGKWQSLLLDDCAMMLRKREECS